MDKRHAYLFCKFVKTEIKKIDQDKFFEGIRIKDDPGQRYVVNWIEENAASWRKNWEKSVCKHCSKWQECGEKVKLVCEEFAHDDEEDKV